MHILLDLVMDQQQQITPGVLHSICSPPIHSYYQPQSHDRALQERCVNRGDETLDDKARRDVRDKAFELFRNTENAFIDRFRKGRFMAVEKSLPDIINDSWKLWENLWKCPQFVTYRVNQPKLEAAHAVAALKVDPSKSTDQNKPQPWQDLSEVAFCRALATYPPIGRCKVPPPHGTGNKPLGRNQLIATMIKEETSQEKHRKQVSSHIQVLRPYVRKETSIAPFVMPFLSLDNSSKHRSCGSNRRRSPNAYMSKSQYRNNQRTTSNRRQGCLPQYALPDVALGSSLWRSCRGKHRPEVFKMFVMETVTEHIVHEFTRFRNRAQLATFWISDFGCLLKEFPQLADFTHEELMQAQIISAESSFKLFNRSLPRDARLAIRLEFGSTLQLDRYDQFMCRVRFFDQNSVIKFPVPRNDDSGLYDEVSEIRDCVGFDAETQRFNVSFGSGFWARRVFQVKDELKMIAELRSKAGLCSDAQAEIFEQKAKQVEAELNAGFRALTALQEVTARNCDTGVVERLLFVCWRFERSEGNRPGQTTWRRIVMNEPLEHTTENHIPPHMQDIKEEMPCLSMKWEDEDTDMVLSNQHDSNLALQQPFILNQAFAVPDFTDMPIAGLTSTAMLDTDGGQAYSDNDYDFSGGHFQLNLGNYMSATRDNQQLPQAANMIQRNILYNQRPSWHGVNPYPDFYLHHIPQNNNSFRVYEHDDSPYSEAGAQQHEMIEPLANDDGFVQTLPRQDVYTDSQPQDFIIEHPTEQHKFSQAPADIFIPQLHSELVRPDSECTSPSQEQGVMQVASPLELENQEMVLQNMSPERAIQHHAAAFLGLELGPQYYPPPDLAIQRVGFEGHEAAN